MSAIRWLGEALDIDSGAAPEDCDVDTIEAASVDEMESVEPGAEDEEESEGLEASAAGAANRESRLLTAEDIDASYPLLTSAVKYSLKASSDRRRAFSGSWRV